MYVEGHLQHWSKELALGLKPELSRKLILRWPLPAKEEGAAGVRVKRSNLGAKGLGTHTQATAVESSDADEKTVCRSSVIGDLGPVDSCESWAK